MATTTTNLSLRKPDSTDFVSHTLDLNANWDAVDSKWASSTPSSIGSSNSAGTALTVARSNHVHAVDSGTVSAPGLPVGEANTGLYRSATGELAVTLLGTLSGIFKSSGLLLEKALGVKKISTPSAPSSGYSALYPKSDESWYRQTSAGAEAALIDSSTYNSYFDRRNHVVNGQFRFARDGTTSTSTDGGFLCEMFRCSLGTGGSPAYTVSRQSHTLADLSGSGEPPYFARFNQTAQATSTAPTFGQRLKSVRRFAGKTVTLSFYAKCSSGTVILTPRIVQNFGSGGSPSSAVNTDGSTATVTTTWTRYSVSIAVPSISGKTIGSTADTDYLEWQLRFPLSSTYQVDISMPQLEEGSAATAFEWLDEAEDLNRLEMYSEVYEWSNASALLGIGLAYTNQNVSCAFQYRQVKAFTPTLAVSSASHFSVTNGTLSPTACNAFAGSSITKQNVDIQAGVATTPLTAGNASVVQPNTTSAWMAIRARY